MHDDIVFFSLNASFVDGIADYGQQGSSQISISLGTLVSRTRTPGKDIFGKKSPYIYETFEPLKLDGDVSLV